MRLVALVLIVLALVASAAAAAPVDDGVRYLESRQQPDGGFAEPGRASDPSLTAWAVLGLVAAGSPPARAAGYLESKPYPTATDLELRILALRALGRNVDALADRLEELRRPDGAIGPLVNSTTWGIIALRAAGRDPGDGAVAYLKQAQAPDGGWSWSAGTQPDTDDTAAAIQALRAAGMRPRAAALRRALAYLRTRQGRDGGFELTPGAGSNAQSTAWAIQAFLAAGRDPGRAAFAYLARAKRPDGSFRFSASHAITPVWVTSYTVAALARRPYPLRP